MVILFSCRSKLPKFFKAGKSSAKLEARSETWPKTLSRIGYSSSVIPEFVAVWLACFQKNKEIKKGRLTISRSS
jgi:hypothetical protein